MQSNRERGEEKKGFETSLYIPAINLMRLTNMCAVYILQAAIGVSPMLHATSPPLPSSLNITFGPPACECCCGPPAQVAVGRQQRR